MIHFSIMAIFSGATSSMAQETGVRYKENSPIPLVFDFNGDYELVANMSWYVKENDYLDTQVFNEVKTILQAVNSLRSSSVSIEAIQQSEAKIEKPIALLTYDKSLAKTPASLLGAIQSCYVNSAWDDRRIDGVNRLYNFTKSVDYFGLTPSHSLFDYALESESVKDVAFPFVGISGYPLKKIAGSGKVALVLYNTKVNAEFFSILSADDSVESLVLWGAQADENLKALDPEKHGLNRLRKIGIFGCDHLITQFVISASFKNLEVVSFGSLESMPIRILQKDVKFPSLRETHIYGRVGEVPQGHSESAFIKKEYLLQESRSLFPVIDERQVLRVIHSTMVGSHESN